MAGGPFLLSEEDQDEENRRQLANFAADQMDGQRQAFGLAPAPRIAQAPRNAPGQLAPRRQNLAFMGDAMFDNGMNAALGGFNMAQGMASEQGAHLAGMINQANRAWENELDSRVAQSREMRRMEHEREMERLRQEGLLKRLQAEQQAAMMQMRAADDARNGVSSRTFLPGRGFVPTWMT